MHNLFFEVPAPKKTKGSSMFSIRVCNRIEDRKGGGGERGREEDKKEGKKHLFYFLPIMSFKSCFAKLE